MAKKKSDYAHNQTDKMLAELETKISKTYKQAYKDTSKTVKDYFQQFAKRDLEEQKRLEAGEITERTYNQWRLTQMARGGRYTQMRDKLAERYTKANEVAVSYVNDATAGIYSLNRNYAEYTIEKVGGSVGFTLWDERTVKRLIVEEPNLMPYYPVEKAVRRGIDLAYGKQQITAAVTSGILQGESPYKIADDLMNRITTMSQESAIRTARTAVTEAENAGRQDTYEAAENMGIEMEKEWVATLDDVTRETHQEADGQVVDYDEPFEVGGDHLMYPGDPSGSPEEVYNCRCTMIARVKNVDMSNAQRWSEDGPVDNMTYEEWLASKEGNGSGEASGFYNSNTVDDQYRYGDPMNEYDYYSKDEEEYRLNAIQEETGFDDEKSQEILEALCGTRSEWSPSETMDTNPMNCWFYGGDSSIRNLSSEDSIAKANTINDYISAAPKYEGEIYRGMSLSDDTINAIISSGKFEETGSLTSWTSTKDVADMFAQGRSEELGTTPVILQSENPSMGVPTGHLSIFGSDENEVLVSNLENKSYTVESTETINGVVYIKLSEG